MAGVPRLGMIAGGGDLPRRVAEHARATGRFVYIVGLRGFADPALIAEIGGVEVSMGEIGRAIDLLKQAACEEMVFAGSMKRPDLSTLKFDGRGMQLLPKLMGAAMKGDDAMLRVVLNAFEQAGFRVVGADDVLTGLLVQAGSLGAHKPSEAHWPDIRLAAHVASAIGALDIGQGAVVCNGLVLAVEAQEGTDNMLARCATLPAEIRGTAAARRGVLVKRPKPIQERRIDLPTIGAETVRRCAEAGLAGIAVEAGAALILQRSETIAAADAAGLFIHGFTPDEAAGAGA